jgi:heavy metal sensor kinase
VTAAPDSLPDGTVHQGEGRGLAWPWSDSLAARLTLWYGLIIGLCLVAYSLAVGFSVQRHVYHELDRRLHEEVELAARTLVVGDRGQPVWSGDTLGLYVDEEKGWERRIEVWDLAGSRLLATGPLELPDLGPPRGDQEHRRARTRELPRGSVRTMDEDLRSPHGRFILRAAVSEAGARAQIRQVWLELLTLSAGVVVLGGLGGALLARRSLRPLARMARDSRRITAERLAERLPPQQTAELEHIRVAFNETLERLERSFSQLRRFTADASHELRTPLTTLRSVGEVGLQSVTTTEEAREVISSMLEEVDRLARLAEELLTLARAEAGEASLRLEAVDLSGLARDVVGHLGVLAEERRQSLEADTDGPVLALGDRTALRQAVVNLVDNAIKYSPDSTFITLATGQRGRTVFLEVRDEGPGLGEDDQQRIFERFYRVDKSRSRQMGGTGLGLSLVRWTAEAHHGRVELDSALGRGSTFRLVLPPASTLSS